ncbi:MAG: ABC transporter permease [Planctomycetales bacterium]
MLEDQLNGASQPSLERAPGGSPSAAAPGEPSVFSACARLFWVTIRRQMFSRQTLVGLALAGLCCLIVLAWSRHHAPTAKRFAEQILVPTYLVFLLPVLAVCYGASGIGGEREEGTLIYLLIVPIPRPLIYLVKFAATVGLVVAGSLGTLAALCLLAGASGRETFPMFFMSSLLGSAAYASLFLMLGAAFRHGTVIALAYWFFLEVLLGNMPGIVKRVSIAFYMRCLVYDAGAELELAPLGRAAREMYLPISGAAAQTTLVCAIAGLLTVGLWAFSRREYRDLS